MNRLLKRVVAILLLVTVALHTVAQQKITVAVAANMQYAIQEVIAAFNKKDRTKVEVVIGASGKLTQQILQGAPFDVFIAADQDFPQKIAAGKLSVEPPKIYAQGILVLWTMKENIPLARNLRSLLGNDVKAIAIANPATAPYGRAAQALLKKYGLYQKVASKIVTGESISQASQFIATGNADIGFTAKSIVVSDAMKGKGKWIELESRDYPPIHQAAVLIKHTTQENAQEALTFYQFLFSTEAKTIYRKFGYIVK